MEIAFFFLLFLHCWTGLSPPVKYFTGRSKAVVLLWIFYVFVLSCVCYVFVRVCLYVLCGHLLGKGWPLDSRLWCLLWVCHFPIGILGQVWYLIVLIPSLCTLTYFAQGQVNGHNVLVQRKFYLSQRQIMHKQLSLAFTVLILKVNFFFENSMKSDINSSENCVDPGSILFSKQHASLIQHEIQNCIYYLYSWPRSLSQVNRNF